MASRGADVAAGYGFYMMASTYNINSATDFGSITSNGNEAFSTEFLSLTANTKLTMSSGSSTYTYGVI
jgi:hypothetical protein